MAFLAYRISRGKKYWSIVESRRINKKPRSVIIQYLGTADTLFNALNNKNISCVKSYSHGDTQALLDVAEKLDIVSIINKYIPDSDNGKKPIRDNLTVGGSLLLSAINRSCHPTSKEGWREWAKKTSLDYSIKKTFKELDSRHFWEQMDFLPVKDAEAFSCGLLVAYLCFNSKSNCNPAYLERFER